MNGRGGTEYGLGNSYSQARAYVRWPMPTVCAIATTASRAFSAASLEPSASALEPSPNSYFVLPVASRIIRWTEMGGGTVSGVQEHNPPSFTEGASWLGQPSAACLIPPPLLSAWAWMASGAVLPICGLACRAAHLGAGDRAFCRACACMACCCMCMCTAVCSACAPS